MKITTVGIDLAKNVFQVHAVDEDGKVALRKQLKREQMATFFVNLPSCLVGMEACASAHYWARKLHSMGHQVKLIAPQFVNAMRLRRLTFIRNCRPSRRYNRYTRFSPTSQPSRCCVADHSLQADQTSTGAWILSTTRHTMAARFASSRSSINGVARVCAWRPTSGYQAVAFLRRWTRSPGTAVGP